MPHGFVPLLRSLREIILCLIAWCDPWTLRIRGKIFFRLFAPKKEQKNEIGFRKKSLEFGLWKSGIFFLLPEKIIIISEKKFLVKEKYSILHDDLTVSHARTRRESPVSEIEPALVTCSRNRGFLCRRTVRAPAISRTHVSLASPCATVLLS